MSSSIDEKSVTKAAIQTVSKLPALTVQAGPQDGELWIKRLEEEYLSLIKLVELTKEQGNDWFRIESTEDGTSWFGMCWHVHNHIKYEFDLQFELPVTYPTTPPEIELPQLDGKTAKMYRGGKICLTDHFFPLWARNVPKFGIVHALLLGLAPWLNAEIPYLIEQGILSATKGTLASTASK